MNVCSFAGNVGKDPEARTTNNGMTVLTFSLAVNERRKNGERWEDATEWVPIVLFGKRAEALGRLVTKGSKLAVTGRLRTRCWDDRDGNKRYRTEIVAEDVTLQGGRRGAASASEPADAYVASEPFDGDEIPF